AQAPSVPLLEVVRVQVKWLAQPLPMYPLLGAVRNAAFERLAETQARFRAAYRSKDWAMAARELTSCRALAPDLGDMFDRFERRIADYLRQPPPAEWDGVFVAVSKTG